MKIRWFHGLALMGLALGMNLSSTALGQEGVKEEFMSSGLTRARGGYSPLKAEMDQEASIVTKSPEDLKNPKFGFLEDGDKKWAFILDEPEEGEAKLYIDTNADGDLTNDPETKWASEERGGQTMYQGSGEVEIGDGQNGVVNLYRFDPTDERRAALKNTMLYYADYGSKYVITMDGQDFDVVVSGAVKDGEKFGFDRNGDGRKSRNFESATVGEPFNFTGTTYLLSAEDGKLTIAKAEKELPLAPMPPDLTIGKQALEFAAKTIDGEDIEFPASYKGKVVMLDFWATWCGPCIGEIPNMKVAYKNWHKDGFEILGISFDRADMEEKLQEFRESRELPWPQVYEGKFWETTIGQMHDVSGIPFVLLVDGDTGEILGTSRELRGKGLSKFIGEQLVKKGLVTEERLEASEKDDDGEEKSDDDK